MTSRFPSYRQGGPRTRTEQGQVVRYLLLGLAPPGGEQVGQLFWTERLVVLLGDGPLPALAVSVPGDGRGSTGELLLDPLYSERSNLCVFCLNFAKGFLL
jgi:hypothetical protein